MGPKGDKGDSGPPGYAPKVRCSRADVDDMLLF